LLVYRNKLTFCFDSITKTGNKFNKRCALKTTEIIIQVIETLDWITGFTLFLGSHKQVLCFW
jgi:hypothetical protein